MLVWLSLAMCVLTCVMWVRSYLAYEVIDIHLRNQEILIGAPAGGVVVYSFEKPRRVARKFEYRSWPFPAGFDALLNTMLGFHASSMGEAAMIAVPFWFLLLLTLVTPLVRWRLSGPHAAGLCRDCGYDLRATPERCPECGAVPSAGHPSTGA